MEQSQWWFPLVNKEPQTDKTSGYIFKITYCFLHIRHICRFKGQFDISAETTWLNLYIAKTCHMLMLYTASCWSWSSWVIGFMFQWCLQTQEMRTTISPPTYFPPICWNVFIGKKTYSFQISSLKKQQCAVLSSICLDVSQIILTVGVREKSQTPWWLSAMKQQSATELCKWRSFWNVPAQKLQNKPW